MNVYLQEKSWCLLKTYYETALIKELYKMDDKKDTEIKRSSRMTE